MGTCRLGLAVVAILTLLIALKPVPALTPAMIHADASVRAAAALVSPVVSGHFRRTQSFYCYPRNYWWFYRPYTTAFDGHARCMPYFHYPDGAKPDRYIK